MKKPLRDLFEPMNLAAYGAWGAIGVELWGTRPEGTGLVVEPWLSPLLWSLHAAFLLVFVARQVYCKHAGCTLLAVAAQFAFALAMVPLSRAGTVPILIVIAFAQLAQLLAPRLLALAFVLVNLFLYASYRYAWQMSSPEIGAFLHASFQLFAIATAWYAVTAERSRDALAAANAELLATRSLLAESARDSERLRLSRELHDVAGHTLTALKLNLRALQRQPALAGDAQLDLCARLADELLGDIRGLVQQMRLHDGVELGELVQRLATPFPKPRMHLEIEPGLRVPSIEQAEAVLRTVQEALTNAARHGGAENLWMRMQRHGDQLQLELLDDGRGLGGPLRLGNGLTGMRERLLALGGDLKIEAGEQRGVRLRAWLPLAPIAVVAAPA